VFGVEIKIRRVFILAPGLDFLTHAEEPEILVGLYGQAFPIILFRNVTYTVDDSLLSWVGVSLTPNKL
jgi:hypothetical protein